MHERTSERRNIVKRTWEGIGRGKGGGGLFFLLLPMHWEEGERRWRWPSWEAYVEEGGKSPMTKKHCQGFNDFRFFVEHANSKTL